MKINNILAYTAFCAFIITGCAGGDKKAEAEKEVLTADSTGVASNNVIVNDNKAQQIFAGYITLKDALVITDPNAAKTAAAALLTAMEGYNGVDASRKAVQEIAASTDVAAQRKAFTGLSNDMISLFKKSGVKEGKIYVQHCPMANNGDGGDWLAVEAKIQNPYYGDEMMECGAVVEEIKSK